MAEKAEKQPTLITNKPWVIYPNEEAEDELEKRTHGKWMVYRRFDELDAMWEELKENVSSKTIEAYAMKCSTLMYNPTDTGPGPCNSGAIRVHVGSQDDIVKVGEQLVRLVKHDILYKCNKTTENGVYTHTSKHRPSSFKYFWNDGEPKMIELTDEDIQLDGIVETPHHIDTNDEWKLNIVSMQQHRARGHTGQWVIKYPRTTSGERSRITDDWHAIKSLMESGRLPAIRMICPNKRREDCAIIVVHTTRTNRDTVGSQLEELLKRTDLKYECPIPRNT